MLSPAGRTRRRDCAQRLRRLGGRGRRLLRDLPVRRVRRPLAGPACVRWPRSAWWGRRPRRRRRLRSSSPRWCWSPPLLAKALCAAGLFVLWDNHPAHKCLASAHGPALSGPGPLAVADLRRPPEQETTMSKLNPSPVDSSASLIPFYNEAQRSPPARARVPGLTGRAVRYEILRSSTTAPRTAPPDVVDELAGIDPAPARGSAGPNRGKGAAVRVGMLDARGRIRVMCDADGSMPPEELPEAARAVAREACADRDRLALRCRGRRSRPGSRLAPSVEPAVQQLIQNSLCRACATPSAASRRSRRRRGAACSARPHRRLGLRPRIWLRAAAATRSPRSAGVWAHSQVQRASTRGVLSQVSLGRPPSPSGSTPP